MSHSRRKRRRPPRKPPTAIVPRESPPPQHTLWVVLCVAVVALLAYANTLAAPFLYDDKFYVVQHTAIRSLGNIFRFWVLPFPNQLSVGIYRPLTATVFAVVYALAGLHPWAFHLANVLLHAAVSVTVVVFLLRLRLPWAGALFGGLLFAVHPVHTEAVAWVSGCSGLLAALFVMLATLSWLAWRRTGRGRWLAAAAVAYFLGLGGKEIAVALPAALLVIDFYSLFARDATSWDAAPEPAFAALQARKGSRGSLWGYVLTPYLAFVASLAVYLGLRFAALGGLTYRPALLAFTGDPRSTRILTGLAGMARYVWLLFAPFDLRIIYDHKQTSFGLPVVEGLAVLVGLAVVVLWRWRKDPWTVLAIGWFASFIAVVSNLIIEIGAIFAERFLYTPSIGLSLLAAVGVGRLLAAPESSQLKRRLTVAACAAITLVAVGATMDRNRDWGDALRFWRLALHQAPSSVKAHENLATVLTQLGHARHDSRLGREAADVRQQGVTQRLRQTEPWTEDDVQMLSQLAQQLRAQNRYAAALVQYKRLTPLLLKNPELPVRIRIDGLLGHSATLEALGRYDAAIAVLQQGMKAFPKRAAFVMELGTILKKRGDLTGAIAKYRQALAVDPGYTLAHINLASALAAHGELNAAFEQATRAIDSGDEAHVVGLLTYLLNQVGQPPPATLEAAALRGVSEALRRQFGDRVSPAVARVQARLARDAATLSAP